MVLSPVILFSLSSYFLCCLLYDYWWLWGLEICTICTPACLIISLLMSFPFLSMIHGISMPLCFLLPFLTSWRPYETKCLSYCLFCFLSCYYGTRQPDAVDMIWFHSWKATCKIIMQSFELTSCLIVYTITVHGNWTSPFTKARSCICFFVK
jgi:hypothetical protein